MGAENNQKMPLYILTAILLLLLLSPVQALDLGYGGLPGERTPNTGSVWPPYPGAGQGYWAARAGFYKTRPEKITSAQSDTETVVEPGNSFVYNGKTRYIP